MSCAQCAGTWSRRGRTIVLFPGGATASPGSFSGPEESEGELPLAAMDFGAFPASVRTMLGRGLETAAIRLAVTFGIRDEARLTDLIFYTRHSERRGRRLAAKEAGFKRLRSEWLDIRDRLVRPALIASVPSGPSPSLPSGAPLRYGVPGGKITWGFLARMGTTNLYHPGIDISISNAQGQGAEDPRRGLPVYAALRPSIDIATLNTVQVKATKTSGPPWKSGLGIPGRGAATLRDARVHLFEGGKGNGLEYGGGVGLICRYIYTKNNGTPGIFTLYVDYWHLITPSFLPKDGRGRVMTLAEWIAAGKKDRMDLGPKMVDGAVLLAKDLTNPPPLVGFLGATEFPHVHISVNYQEGEADSHFYYPRLDPTVVVQ
jgi:hypothetical protein